MKVLPRPLGTHTALSPHHTHQILSQWGHTHIACIQLLSYQIHPKIFLYKLWLHGILSQQNKELIGIQTECPNITLHREHVLPMYFSLHWHWPVKWSHFSLAEPNSLQLHAITIEHAF